MSVSSECVTVTSTMLNLRCLVIKTDVACGSSASHQMALVHKIDEAIDWMKQFAFGETSFVMQVGLAILEGDV
jgi:hypothetical protein